VGARKFEQLQLSPRLDTDETARMETLTSDSSTVDSGTPLLSGVRPRPIVVADARGQRMGDKRSLG